jgi:hypothetical protein
VLCNSKDCKILLAPSQARDGSNDIVLERSGRDKFGNEIPMQFLEISPTLAGKDRSRGIAAVFQGGMKFIGLIDMGQSLTAGSNELPRVSTTGGDA